MEASCFLSVQIVVGAQLVMSLTEFVSFVLRHQLVMPCTEFIIFLLLL